MTTCMFFHNTRNFFLLVIFLCCLYDKSTKGRISPTCQIRFGWKFMRNLTITSPLICKRVFRCTKPKSLGTPNHQCDKPLLNFLFSIWKKILKHTKDFPCVQHINLRKQFIYIVQKINPFSWYRNWRYWVICINCQFATCRTLSP